MLFDVINVKVGFKLLKSCSTNIWIMAMLLLAPSLEPYSTQGLSYAAIVSPLSVQLDQAQRPVLIA